MIIFKRKQAWLWFIILCALMASPIAIASEYLSETKEVVFDPELIKLAEDLDHDPVKIYNWVYENIEFEDYDYARKNALNVYWTKRGNEWDQSTLLITLMRLSNIQARYVKYNDAAEESYYANRPFVEVLLPIGAYRGQGYGNSNSDHKLWIPLIPWKKEYKTTVGLDLFPDNTIPAELNFDFEDYVKTIQQKTALELYEEQLQGYLDIHHPGKALKDIGYKQTIIKKSPSLLPLSLPESSIDITDEAVPEYFSSIPNQYKYKLTYYVKRYSDEVKVLEYDIYIPEISTSRVVLDFIPYDTANANKIAPYQLITKTPDGAALVKAVLKVDGNVVASSSAFTIGDYFVDGQNVFDEGGYTSRKKVGVTMSLDFDDLVTSEKMIEKWKSELSNLSLDLLDNDFSKEAYLGRYLSIIAHTHSYRRINTRRKIDNYFNMTRNYAKYLRFNRAYTFADNINVNHEEKFSISNSMKFDARVINPTGVYKSSTGEYVDYHTDIRQLIGALYINNSSYNEGLIFEDWQSTPGGSTVKALMVAYEQGVPVVTLTRNDIENGHLYILENQTNNRYSDHTIQQIINELQRDSSNYWNDGVVTLPVQRLEYEGAILLGRISPRAYWFSIDGGGLNDGGGSVAGTRPLVFTTFFFDPSGSAPSSNRSFLSGNSSSGSSGSSRLSYSFDNSWSYRQVSYDGDPVDMLTGEFYQEEVPDLTLKSVAENTLSIQRTYKSRLDYNGAFGYGWAWNHMDRLLPSDDASLLYVDEKATYSTIIQHSNTSYTYPNGATYTLVFANNQYTMTLKNGAQKIFDNNGILLEKIDANGNKILFEYDAQFNVTAIKDNHGKVLTLTYNANNKVTSVTDGNGLTTHYTYDDDDLIAYSDAEGNTTQYEYLKSQENPANNHNMSKYILPNADYLELFYYKNDQVSHHTNKNGDTFNFQYSRYNQYSETWNEAGYYRKVFFNDSGDVIRIDKKDGALEHKEYDDNHNVIAHIDANGHRSVYTYDAKRNILSKTNGLNQTHTYEYDATFNKLTKEVDPNGNTTQYYYDNKGNLARVVDALMHETLYEYDSFGNPIKITDAIGSEAINTYDSTGTYLLSQTDKLDNVTSYTHDTVGNVTATTNAIGHTQHTQYNHNNQIIEQTDESGERTVFGYDENQNLITKTLPNSAVYEYTYHTAKDIVVGNLLAQERDPLGHITHYAYDKLGNRTTVTDKNGNVTRYTYTPLNKVSAMTDANGHTTYYHYDGLGNLTQEVTTKQDGFDTLDVITTYTYDAAARLSRKTLPNGQTIDYEYDSNGNKITEKYTINNEEVITRYTYNALNSITQVIHGADSDSPRVTNIEYDALQRKIRETNAVGVATRYVYDNNNNLLQTLVEAAQGEGTSDLVIESNTYNTLNQLISQTDANGHSTHYTYDPRGQLISKTDALNQRYEYSYDAVGNKTQDHLPTGSRLQYRYDLNNNLIERINALEHSEYLTYDPNGNVIKTLDAKGNATLLAYNPLNQLVAKTDSYGNISTFTYDELGNKTSEVNAEGNIIEYTYDISNNLIQQRRLLSASDHLQTDLVYDTLNRLTHITDANGNTTSYTYNRFNEQTAMTNALSEITTQHHDDIGRVISVTDKQGAVSQNAYDTLGRISATVQASGTSDETTTYFTYDNVGNTLSTRKGNGADTITTEYTYDALNRPLSVSVNGQLTSSQTYNALGKVLSKTDANGHTTQLVYNANSQLTQQTHANGHSTIFTYDVNGNALSQTSPEGVTTINEYDALNRLVIQVTGSDQQLFGYDKASRLISTIDFNGHVARKTYDSVGRVVQKITAHGTAEEATVDYRYDANSNVIGITNANGQTVSYTYDALNRKTQYTTASGSTETYTYNLAGKLATTTQKNNTVVNNTYDHLHRLTRVDVDGIIEQAFAYDVHSRLINSQDHNQGRHTHTVSYTYDHLNNITQSNQNGKVIQHTYDNNANLTAITANGFEVNNSYDSLNSLSVVKVGLSTIADMVYNNDNRQQQVNTANGVTLDIHYDARSRESHRSYSSTHSSTHAPLFDQATSYDPNTNVIAETITHNNQTLIKHYQYDAQNRLTNDEQNNHYFAYDNNGNITHTNHAGIDDTRTVNSDDEFTHITGLDISYDANGNVSQYKDQAFRYDFANRLTQVIQDGQTIASYTYDAENRRVSKTVNGTTTTYVYHKNQVVQEYTNAQSDASISYIYSDTLDDPIAFMKDNAQYFYIKDRIGSIRAITDSAGNIVERYRYNAFGIMRITDANGTEISASNYGNTYTYTGRRFDAETGLYYYRNRMYSAALGRFISEDPLGYVDGYNLYRYVRNNPLKYVDPMGTTSRYRGSINSSLVSGITYQYFGSNTRYSNGRYYGRSTNYGSSYTSSSYSGYTSNSSGSGYTSSASYGSTVTSRRVISTRTGSSYTGNSSTPYVPPAAPSVAAPSTPAAAPAPASVAPVPTPAAESASESGGSGGNVNGNTSNNGGTIIRPNYPAVLSSFDNSGNELRLAKDVHLSISIPFVGGVSVGAVTFSRLGKPLHDAGLFIQFSKEQGGLATGKLVVGVGVTKGGRENFDGIGAEINVGVAAIGGNYGIDIDDKGGPNDFQSISIDIGPQLGYSEDATVTFSATYQDLIGLFKN